MKPSSLPNLAVALALYAACSTGCASYHPIPLDELAVLNSLRAAVVEVPSGGLDPDQAAALALRSNPELLTLRRDLETAEQIVLAEGVLKNPELRVGLKSITSTLGNPIALALGLRTAVPIPGEQDARVARARAQALRARAQLEDLEVRVAAEARIAHARVAQLQELQHLVQSSRQVHARIAELVSRRVAAAAATRLDEFVAELERQEVESECDSVGGQLELARARLAELIGAQPGTDIQVHGLLGGEFNANFVESELEDAALAQRADLRALKYEYEAAEQSVRLAHIADGFWPLFLEPNAGLDQYDKTLNLQAAFELPIFDSGRVRLALAEARSRAALAAYTARLTQVRSELHIAVFHLRDAQHRQALHGTRLRLHLESAEEVLESALQSGECDAQRVVTIEVRVLDARRRALDGWFECEQARIELMRATGTLGVDTDRTSKPPIMPSR